MTYSKMYMHVHDVFPYLLNQEVPKRGGVGVGGGKYGYEGENPFYLSDCIENYNTKQVAVVVTPPPSLNFWWTKELKKQ